MSGAPIRFPPNPTPSHVTPTPIHSNLGHHDSLMKGFNMITVAAAFFGAIQAQIMSTTISLNGPNDATVAIRAINSFYIGGLVLDMGAAVLAFLTARWLDRLSYAERCYLESVIDSQNAWQRGEPRQIESWGRSEKVFYTWLGFSLFSPMPLLVLGVLCMISGLITFVWTQQHIVVASLVSLATAALTPMVVGDFFIGREDQARREKLMKRLGEMQGDW